MNYPFENDTSAVIKKLARKSVRFDKKKNLFCLSAIIVAVAMIMMSLLTVQNIIYQNQKEIEGLHQGIFFDITQDSKEKFLANEEVKSVGLSCNIKTVKENSKELSLIYYDDDMLSLIPAFADFKKEALQRKKAVKTGTASPKEFTDWLYQQSNVIVELTEI